MISSQLINPQQQTSSFLRELRSELLTLQEEQSIFKQDTLGYLNQCMGKITTLFHKTARQKAVLEVQLEKSRQTQNIMRAEVIALKQMINEAMIDYSKDLQKKEKQIHRLTLLVNQRQSNHENTKNQEKGLKNEQKEHQSSRQEMLQIIQEQSQQATYSSATSLRQFHSDQNLENRSDSNPLSSRTEQPQQVSLPNCLQENSVEYKKNKKYIVKSKSKVEESENKRQKQAPYQLKIHVKPQNIPQYSKNCNIVPEYNAQPLKQVSNYSDFKYYSNSVKSKDQKSNFTKTIIFQNQTQQSLGDSSIDDLSKVSGIEQESQINAIKKFETPASLFAKKKSSHQRFKTEPSPDHYTNPSNYYSQKPQRDSVKRCDRSYSDSKSFKTSNSKEKIKVTSRMVEEMGYQHKRNHTANNAKAVVYLGGKSIFRKFLLQLKQAFKRYQVNQISQALYLESDPRKKQKSSRGTLLLRNGMVYEGDLRDTTRHGKGSLSLNGISIYEGQWYHDSLHGQGYIKSLRLLTSNCPSVFQEASYCGNLQANRMHGIGTIFLNSKEKIVTKFQGGSPIGELTYYNLHQIEFGVWPSD